MRGTIVSLFVEILILFLFLFGIGFFFNRSDVLFINSPFPFTLLFLVVISLYYGLGAAIIFLGLMVLAGYLFYPFFPHQYIFKSTVFALVCSEFKYNWKTRLDRLNARDRYLEERFEELGEDYYALKISHDQMEESYITKPVSIRRILEDIITGKYKGRDYQTLLGLFYRFFGIEIGAIFVKSGKGEYTLKAELGGAADLDLKDPLVESALARKRAMFVTEIKETGSRYLAILPVTDLTGEICAVMTIEKMPFIQFNRENILSIYVLLAYATGYLEKNRTALLEDLPDRVRACNTDFIAEMKRLKQLSREYGVKSTLLITVVVEGIDLESVREKMSLRALDKVCFLKGKRGLVVLVLMPITGHGMAKGLVDRLRKAIPLKTEDLAFDIGDLDLDTLDGLLERWLS